MRITSIRLNNFRQFEEEEITFSNSPDKNVTVILGDNTYGKTTLVRAFVWCLYGDKSQFKDKILLNDNVARKMANEAEREVKVTIGLEHDGREYEVHTTEVYKKISGRIALHKHCATRLYITDESGTRSIQETNTARMEIGKILSPDLKDYFFFDGETNKIDKVAKSGNLKQAVSDLTGLKLIEDLRDFYNPSSSNSVTSRLRSKLQLDEEGIISGINDELSKAQEEYGNACTAKYNAEKQLNELNEQRTNKEEILDANANIENRQKRKKEIETKLKNAPAEKTRLYDLMIKSLNGNSLLKSLYSYSFNHFAFESIAESSSFTTENSISHISEEAVDQLVKRGYCLCGQKIVDGNDAYKHLMEARLHMEPNDFGKISSDFMDAENQNSLLAGSTLNNILEASNRLSSLYSELDDDEDEYKQLVKELEGRVDVGEIQKDIRLLDVQIGMQEQIKKTAEGDMAKYDKQVSELSSKLAKYDSHTEENKKIEEMIGYAEYIYDIACRKLTKDSAKVRDRLNENVQDIFDKMFHGSRTIEITDSYQVITRANSNTLDESNGLETVKNYAFVAALLKSVKEKLTMDDMNNEEQEDEVYPLILDAPFSDTDNIHIENVCRELPKYCDQIIIMVMEKDYNIAKKALGNRVGEVWRLVKNSETDVNLREANL